MSVLVVGGVSFLSGMKYGQRRGMGAREGEWGSFRNVLPEDRTMRMEQLGGGGNGMRRMGVNGTRGGEVFVGGEVIKKDPEGITLKLRDGGSRIVFTSSSTKVTKNVSGKLEDIEGGNQVLISGTGNQDGSMTAAVIQLSPVIPSTATSTQK